MTIRTSLLESRFLFGDEALYDNLVERFDHEIVATSSATAFVDAKLKERDARVAKAGASRYLVEPNVKDGKGGLRDLNTLFWIANTSTASASPKSSCGRACSRRTSFSSSPAARNSSGACAATCISSPAARRSG